MSLEINRVHQLSADQYIPEEISKDLIVLHHTVGGSASSTVRWWEQSDDRIATAYVIDRDGTVFELFDPKHWAYHLGLKGTRGAHDRRSIGIELASEGGLLFSEDRYYCFDRMDPRTEFDGQVYDHGLAWRDSYRYFAAYTDPQVDSTIMLVDELCERFEIPRQTPEDHFSWEPALKDYRGVAGHHHLRRDKTDLHPGFPWSRLVAQCRLDR